MFEGDDIELSNSLVRLLNEKLEQLERENYDYKYGNDLSSMVWRKFGGRSKKATEENIAAYLADLEDNYSELNYCIDQVKTVKLLKKELAERYDQRRLNPFSNVEFSLDDLNDLFS